MMKPFGLKGLMLLSALVVAGSSVIPAYADSDDHNDGGITQAPNFGTEDNNNAAGSPEHGETRQQQPGGTDVGDDSTGTINRVGQPPIPYPCPPGYLRFYGEDRCSRP